MVMTIKYTRDETIVDSRMDAGHLYVSSYYQLCAFLLLETRKSIFLPSFHSQCKTWYFGKEIMSTL